MKEQIVCSAIHYPDFILKRDDIPLLHYLPINIKSGLVFCGFRHPHCMYTMMNATGLSSRRDSVGREIQGFITNKNRFVDRKEGAIIHKENGGILHYGSILYSEDLY